MNSHETIEFGCTLWWKMFMITSITIVVILYLGYRFSGFRETIANATGILLIAVAILIHPYLAYSGKWNLQSSLPLNLCSLSGILSGVVLLKRNQLAFEFLLYWGISGAIHSLLTPELTLGSGGLLLYEYYISHGGIIFSALYLSIVLKMVPRKNSWLKIFLFTQILLFLVAIADRNLDANYMYLLKKPLVHNPLIIGPWPWYILVLEIVALIHFYLVYLIFRSLRKKDP